MSQPIDLSFPAPAQEDLRDLLTIQVGHIFETQDIEDDRARLAV